MILPSILPSILLHIPYNNMSDSDDDLLALAGAGDEDLSEQEEPVSRKRKAIRSENEEEGANDDEEDEQEANDADEMSDDEVYVNPYPLEGKYKDEDDRDRLEDMTEIERESILFERSQEMQKYNEKIYLQQRAREREQVEKALQRSTRTSARDKSGPQTKRSKLSELKQARQEKHTRAKSRAQGLAVPSRKLHESEESECEDEEDRRGSEGEAYEDEDRVEWADSAKTRDLTVDDVNKIRFGKSLLAQFCHYPEFEQVIQGCFVRVNIGMNQDKQTFTYRVCQVKKVVASNKPYTFLNRTVDESLLVAHGSSEKVFEMGICSDKPVTEEEFRWWKSVMRKKNLTVPSVKSIDRKLATLVEMQKRSLTPEELDEIIKRRQTLSKGSLGANTVIEKSVLQQKRQVALEAGDFAQVDSIDTQIAAVDRLLNRGTKRAEIDRLAKVNERNRIANMNEIRRAEVISQEARRKAELAKTDVNNPFARLRTSARIFYGSSRPAASSHAETAAQEQASVETAEQKLAVSKKLAAVDDVIASLDIGLEIEL